VGKIIFVVTLLALSASAIAFSDPTRPPGYAQSAPKTSKTISKSKQPLTAIFTKGKKRFAIIEDTIYRTGDTYRDAKIIRISSDKVLLRSAEGTRQLTLIPNIKK